LPVSAYVYQPSTVLDTWIRILGGMCQWLHCDTPTWNTDLDHDTPFNHDDPAQCGKTTAAGMKPYCRNHHRLKHSEAWSERHNAERSIDLTAPTGHQYRARNAGYLDLLGVDPAQVIDATTADNATGRRPTRAENKAARIRDERRRRQAHLDLKQLQENPPVVRRLTRIGERPSPDADEPCPF